MNNAKWPVKHLHNLALSRLLTHLELREEKRSTMIINNTTQEAVRIDNTSQMIRSWIKQPPKRLEATAEREESSIPTKEALTESCP
jgi:hypothetical protein